MYRHAPDGNGRVAASTADIREFVETPHGARRSTAVWPAGLMQEAERPFSLASDLNKFTAAGLGAVNLGGLTGSLGCGPARIHEIGAERLPPPAGLRCTLQRYSCRPLRLTEGAERTDPRT